jgi:alkylglycerol monooxygenase
MNLNPIVLSIPIFFLLIGVELLVERFRGEKVYRLNDALTNISCGIASQVAGIFMKLIVVGVYQYLYEHYAWFHIPANWITGIILFVAVDFCYYWFHRYSHEINLFWGGHVVHHQSEEYNLSVALRQGSFQSLFSFAFYLPLALIGFETIQFVTVSALVTLYQFWIHTKAIHKLPAPVEFIFNTPSHHRVHHGVNPKYIDKNHGGTFIIWDRMFGTFQEEEEEPVYGITKPVGSWNPVWVNLQHYVELAQLVRQVPAWSDKLRVMFMPPGWRPAYMGGPLTVPEVDRTQYRKYDLESPTPLNYYVLFQFVITLVGASVFMFSVGQLDTFAKLASAGMVMWAIVNCGGLFEQRNWVYVLEWVRLTVSSIALGYLFRSSGQFGWLVVGLAAFCLVSSVWLYRLRKLWRKASHRVPA